MWEYERERFLYGFPDIGYGAKVARHHEGILVDPDHVPREVSAAEVESMRQLIHPLLPDLDGGFKEATVCIYTNIPDGHFLLDRHPEFEPVWLVSPCSGHGFKFSSAIGEIVCELVEKGRSEFDLSLFRWRWPDQ
jgi:glycine/D-amino acid oxidase-like deaminating enzyme